MLGTHLKCFDGAKNCVCWRGRKWEKTEEFHEYLKGKVYPRLVDDELQVPFKQELREFAEGTSMSPNALENFLSENHERQPWEVGEALAECLLEDEFSVIFPWNTERDKRTPLASLPGADIIGFITVNGETLLVFGEVKTSSDMNNPPGVMSGRSGMVQQLEELATNRNIHKTILTWLRARCTGDLFESYKSATRLYISSQCKSFRLLGILMRDTEPAELDVKNRAEALSINVESPTQAEFHVWYFPCSTSDWPNIVMGNGS